MNTLLTPLLARLTSATGVTFAVTSAGDIVCAGGDAFKLAAIVDLASRAANGLVPACSITTTHPSLSGTSLTVMFNFTLTLNWADGTKGKIRVLA